MSVDEDFTAMVQAWEYRLGVLNQMVGSVEPSPEVWDRIRTAIGHSEPQAPLLLPEDSPPPAVHEVAAPAADTDRSIVIRLSRRRPGAGAPSPASRTAIAAALVALIAVAAYQPDLLPDAIRPRPRIQVVEVKTPPTPAPPSAQYVAVLQKEGGSPAFILTVDARNQEFHGSPGRRRARARQEL